MPDEYEAIRDALHAKGMPLAQAKSIAAATYNKKHPDRPVTGHHAKGKKKGTKKAP